MPPPLLALLLGGAAIALAVVLFWPERGLAGRWLRGAAARDRVEVEDALKHLWDGEYRRQPSTLQSLAGALGLGGRRVAELVTRLERLGLVELDGTALRLSAAGRRDALRVVRIHRLWERYLADETGLGAEHWHARAERLEHRTSAARAEQLDARLGFPRFDPHGDPIPNRQLEMPDLRTTRLSDVQVGMQAVVKRIATADTALLRYLAALGLTPGRRLRVLQVTPFDGNLHLQVEGQAETVVLGLSVTRQVFVEPLNEL